MKSERISEPSGIVIRRKSGLPVYLQIVDQLRYLIGAGRYMPGEYLPTLKQLAEELALNLNTVNRAFQELQREGLIESTPGKGAVVVDPRALAGQTRESFLTRYQTPVDAILAAALERALSTGLGPADVASRVASLLDDMGRRVPSAERVGLFAGPAWRGAALATKLSAVCGLPAVPVTPGDDTAPRLVVRPRYGAWEPEYRADDETTLLDLPVLPEREAVRQLLDAADADVCVAAADDEVGRWILDAVTTFARPASVRSVIADELPPDAIRSGELAVVEVDLPGTERLVADAPSRVLVFRATFPPTAAELVKSELRRLRTEGQKQKAS